MSTNDNSPLTVSSTGTLLIPTGYPGPAIRIRAGALDIDAGFGRTLRVHRSSRPRLKRLVILGRAGWWSFEVPAWLDAVGASWIHMARNGDILGAGPTTLGTDHPRLRAAQAVAADTQLGVEISRSLISQKLSAQHRLIQRRCPDADDVLDRLARAVNTTATATTLPELRVVEADGAAAYFSAWPRFATVQFCRKDAGLVPEGWHRFASRGSVITGDSQHATTPINAALNLGYQLLLVETQIAMQIVGLDSGVPFGLHSYQRNRPSGALDLLEPCRPVVDEIILKAFASAVFGRRDFREQADGTIHLSTTVTRGLLDAMPQLAAAVAPVVEQVAQTLATGADLGKIPTPLTGTNRSTGRDGLRKRRTPAPRTRQVTLASRCRECGTDIPTGRIVCDSCHTQQNNERLITMNEAVTAARRETGTHPAKTREVRTKIAQRQREQWQRREAAGTSPGWSGEAWEFKRLILPRLAGLPPSQLAAATGLSANYCRLIRDGKVVPHVRHWAALRLPGAPARD